jgi:integrase
MSVAGTRHWRNQLDCFRRLRKSFRRQVEARRRWNSLSISGSAGTATRVVELLGGVWTWAAKREHVAPLSVKKGVDRVKSSPKARALSPTELKTLGEAVRTAEPKDPMAAAAPKLLALTGMRRQEAVKLMWSEYDRAGSCLHLGDTKTGRSTRPLGAAAAALLDAWAASGTHPTLVFPNARGNGPADLKKKLAAIFDAAGLSPEVFGRDIAAEGLRLAAEHSAGPSATRRRSACRYRRGGTRTPA